MLLDFYWSNLNVSKCDKSANARTVTAVTILANVQYTVSTFDHIPNLDITWNTDNVSYICRLVSYVVQCPERSNKKPSGLMGKSQKFQTTENAIGQNPSKPLSGR
jgi:hypothetical protein